MKFDFSIPLEFLFKGCFQAPDENWVHMSREIDSYEIFYVTKGTLYISDDETDYTVGTGEYLVTPPCKNQHGWKASPCEFYYFHFYAEEKGAAFPQYGTCKNLDLIEKYYSLLSDSGSRQETDSHLIAILLEELRNGDTHEMRETFSETCRSIQSYVKFAQSERLRVSFLSKKFGYHEKYLSQSFKKEMGIPLKRYLKEEIISRAKHMLIHTDLPVAKIGEQLGYCDAHSFSHIFKNDVGVSPKEYRRKNRLPFE
ncbi:MAG: AraC family transcriptional regulator [Eubacteriales bacterium]|nr:AraC family transcriptional regulator [Eubacteriales bacterium]